MIYAGYVMVGKSINSHGYQEFQDPLVNVQSTCIYNLKITKRVIWENKTQTGNIIIVG